MARLDLANLKAFEKELKTRKISEVGISEFYETRNMKHGPFTKFGILVTAIDLETRLILRHMEHFGGDCSYFEDRMKEISKNALERGKEIRKHFETMKGIRVIHGEFKEGGG